MGRSVDFGSLIARAADGHRFSENEARDAFAVMMSGDATPAQIGALLMAMRVRGETIEEITGAVRIMREKMIPVSAPDNAMDIVGTGGDASGSYNISTAAAFVVAGAGTPVAKHGNRALSSISGAADVLIELGVNVELQPARISACIERAGIGFMFAPAHHKAMRHVGPVRIELGTRTMFNLLGPLSNPAGVTRQLTGVFAPEWVVPLARVLGNLGCRHAWVVHGDGLDEISVSGPTMVAEIRNGEVREFTVTPADAGLGFSSSADLKGGDAAYNAEALRAVLRSRPGAYYDAVVLNAAAALVIAGVAGDMAAGAARARQAIASGAALETLERLVQVSNERT